MHVFEVAGVESNRCAVLMDSRLADDLQSDIVLEILVCGEAYTQIHPSVFTCDLEVPFAKDVVFAFLKRHEVACVLLVDEVLLGGEVVLLRHD